MIKIYSPASIGNINVGFDTLGIALAPQNGQLLGDCVSIHPSKNFQLQNIGKFAYQLPKDIKNNIVWKCWNKFCKIIGKEILASITLEKNMPISSGLGSSACSIVATIIAINEFCNQPLNKQQLLYLMGSIEGEVSGEPHYDNVAPCLYGGLQLIINENNLISQTIPCFKDWIWIIAWPGIKIQTSKARSILPQQYNQKTCIQHGRLLSSFIHALYTKQSNLALHLMQDVLAEPYRMNLIPDFLYIKKSIINLGANTFGISGSGPTVFSISNSQIIANKISTWLSKNYLKNNNGFVHICKLDYQGTRNIGHI